MVVAVGWGCRPPSESRFLTKEDWKLGGEV